MTRAPALLVALALALFAAACDEPADTSATLTVFAASSLTEAFDELGRAFEAANPEIRVAPSFAGSQVLRLQIEHGAPADVFASADERHMAALEEAGLVRGSRVFVHNELVVIVPPDNPAGIETFEELPRAERVVIGDASVPVGRYARQLLSRAADRWGGEFESDVLGRVVSEEHNVRLVRAKVELGEADAAIVYRTDAVSSGGVRVVEIPDALNVHADYHVAVVAASERQALARRWLAWVEGDAAGRVLSEHGFAPR